MLPAKEARTNLQTMGAAPFARGGSPGEVTMDRIRIAVILGVVCCIGGILFSVNASNLATHWEMIGENAWGGETDPAVARLYQQFGLIALGFGLFILGGTF